MDVAKPAMDGKQVIRKQRRRQSAYASVEKRSDGDERRWYGERVRLEARPRTENMV